MKETSTVIRSGRKGRYESPRARAFSLSITRTRGVLPQPPVELPVADVDRDHHHGAALEQAVGEPAGRRADVQAAAPLDLDRELVERVLQLDPAARDELLALLHHQLGVLVDQLARLLHGRSVPPEPHPAGAHGRRGGGPRRRQPALGEQGVGAATGHAPTVPGRGSAEREGDATHDV